MPVHSCTCVDVCECEREREREIERVVYMRDLRIIALVANMLEYKLICNVMLNLSNRQAGACAQKRERK